MQGHIQGHFKIAPYKIGNIRDWMVTNGKITSRKDGVKVLWKKV